MENDKPLISVIVPVYNGQDYLGQCIESIEKQSYKNLEVIIVNDGSTDKTAEVCDRLRAAYDNIKVLTLDDRGVSAARNAGMDAAAGELVTFVDADDRLRADTLQVLYHCISQTGSDVAGCRFFLWRDEREWEQAEAASARTAEGQTVTYGADRYLREEVLRGNSRCWSKLYRRAVIGKVRFEEGLTIGEDLLFLVRMLSGAGRIAETDYRGYGYFQNPAGAINRPFTPRYMDQITCWRLAREEILRIDWSLEMRAEIPRTDRNLDAQGKVPQADRSLDMRSLDAQVTALWIVGIMLTAGKLALLPASARRGYGEYVETCHENLREAIKTQGAFGRLSLGYRVKAGLFLACPRLYLRLYHWHKRV